MKIVIASGIRVLHLERAVQLELEQRDVAVGGDPVELREERPGPLAPREDVMLEEVALGEPPVELLRRSGTSSARRRRSPGRACRVVAETARRRRGTRGEERLHHRPLAGTRGAGEDEDRSSTG